jgi:hypothetical protein
MTWTNNALFEEGVNMNFHKIMRRGNRVYMLCYNEDIRRAFEYITWVQNTTGIFKNVTMRAYKGKKYNPDRFTWIIEG